METLPQAPRRPAVPRHSRKSGNDGVKKTTPLSFVRNFARTPVPRKPPLRNAAPEDRGGGGIAGAASMTCTSLRASGSELGPTRLCEVRAGDGVRLVEVEGKEARLWLLLAGWVEEQSVEVLRAGRGGVVLSIEERDVTVPGWVARTTLVDCTRRFKTKSTQEERP